jgi:hypothetical protein
MAKANFVRYIPRAGADPIVLKISGKFDPFAVNDTVAALLYPNETQEQILTGAARADAILKRKRAAA